MGEKSGLWLGKGRELRVGNRGRVMGVKRGMFMVGKGGGYGG